MPEESPRALELETRKRIYDHLKKVAGAHMREIGRDVDIPMGTLEYHLHYLVKAGLLTTREDGRYTRYFVVGDLGRREKDVLSVLRQKVPRQIVTHLLLNPGASHGQILQNFRISASTLSFHIKKLLKANVARQEKAGRENLYWIQDPDLVAKVLIAHKESFFDDVVDRFAGVWLSLEPRVPDAEEAAPDERGGGAVSVPVEPREGEAPAPDEEPPEAERRPRLLDALDRVFAVAFLRAAEA